ncbi:MAG: antitoxin VapB family protein [Candidatus Nanohaloarchaea archaeon]
MGSKTISLKDEAYRRLKALKGDEKSFSDVVMELTEEKKKGLEKLRDFETDYTVEDLKEDRENEDFTDEEREELLR